MGTTTVGFIMVLISLATFLMEGKQWPTFVTASLGGICIGFGSKAWGSQTVQTLDSIFSSIKGFIF